jgi:uncharacterized protein (DUF849 family)
MAAMSIRFGGDVRIGVEDTSWLANGELARGNVAMGDALAPLSAEPATADDVSALMARPRAT